MQGHIQRQWRGDEKIGDRRCCCGCPVHTDDFNRGDNTDLGTDWTELVGDSEIYSNTLRMPLGGEVARIEQELPRAWVLYISILNCQPGVTYRIICNLSKDATNINDESFQFVEISLPPASDPQQVTVRLRSHAVGGALTTIVEGGGSTNIGGVNGAGCTAGNSLNLLISYAGDELWCVSGGTDAPVWVCNDQEVDANDRIALWNGGTTDVRWDNVEIEKHREVVAKCPDCICTCEGHCIPPSLTATITGENTCPPWHNAAILLERVSPNFGTAWFATANTKPACQLYSGMIIDLTTFRLVCGGTVTNPIFYFEIQGNSCEVPLISLTPTSIQCDPLVIVFDLAYDCSGIPSMCHCCNPHNAPWDPLNPGPLVGTCGFKITITE